MFVPQHVKERVNNKLHECIALVQKRYGVQLQFPKVVYEKRGTTAGTANYRTWTIDLNPVLLMENLDDFIARTVPHELAHLACDKIYPEAHRPGLSAFSYSRPKREVHGPRWQEIMRALGADASRCHTYDTTNSKVVKSNSRQIEWTCSRCSAAVMLTPSKSAALDANPGSIWHRGCRGAALVRKGSTPAPAPRLTITAPAPVAPVRTQQPLPVFGASKLDSCKRIYVTYRQLSRADLIRRFMSDAGCTPAGAATYYATCKKIYG